MTRLCAAAFCAALLALAMPAIAQDDTQKLLAYGEHLSGECVSCHRADGTDVGIPSITCLSKKEFIDALLLYKTGLRTNPVMVSLASSLNDKQMRALAEYWAKLRKQSSRCPPISTAGGGN